MSYMETNTLFDAAYEARKPPLLKQVVDRLEPIYSQEESNALRIDPIDRSCSRMRTIFA